MSLSAQALAFQQPAVQAMLDRSDKARVQRLKPPKLRLFKMRALMAVLVLMTAGCSHISGRADSSGAPSAGGSKLTRLTIGLAGHGIGALPIYLAAERTFAEEGLSADLIVSGSGAAIAQAFAADSLDVSVASLSTLINMIEAGVSAKAFYAGFNQADFEWFARAEIKTWADLRGRTVGVASYADLTTFLTREVLRRHELDPNRDVDIRAMGGSGNSLQALRNGQLDMAILAPPLKFQAEAEGFTRLGTQASEVAEQWPKNVLIAKQSIIDNSPDLIRALLRAHVKAIRQARNDREATVETITSVLKYERQYAEKAYDEVMPGFDERGRLPSRAMPVFWEVSVSGGELKEPWPESRFLDSRFINTFDEWAPQ